MLFINATELNLTYVGFAPRFERMHIVAKSDFMGEKKLDFVL